MKVIQEKIITSQFGEKKSEIFYYFAEKPSNKVLFILKGLYGLHRSVFEEGVNLKWESRCVQHCIKDVNVVCFNTSHKKIIDELDREQRKVAYDGKTFEQEVEDVQKVIARVKTFFKDRGVQKLEFFFLGKSFGGTLLLTLQEALEAKALFMIGSGCGKSSSTTKTLLRTMPDEAILLKNIRIYKGSRLYFFRGELDLVVPKESQEKIVNAAPKNKVEYIILSGTDHEFEKVNGEDSGIPMAVVLQKLKESFSL